MLKVKSSFRMIRSEKAVQLDIQTLTCVLMNYRRPAYLARIERLHTDSDTLQLLETIIPDMEAYFGDYF